MLKIFLKIGNFIYQKKIKKIPGVINLIVRIIYGCDIPCSLRLPKNIYFAHNGLGVIINESCILGENITIYPHVILGKHKGLCPIIGDNVFIGAKSMILGGVKIGAGAKIGAGSIVMKDVQEGEIIIPVSTKMKNKNN